MVVPVGVGVVVPCQKIIDILEGDDVTKARETFVRSRQMPAAKLDSVKRKEQPDENPMHLEDFKRLVDLAARKQEKD